MSRMFLKKDFSYKNPTEQEDAEERSWPVSSSQLSAQSDDASDSSVASLTPGKYLSYASFPDYFPSFGLVFLVVFISEEL